MTLLATDAVVLHAFDYLESSRILRLATRDAGVQSVVARGARSSQRRFGRALDLFAGGVAEIQVRPGRELQTLASFEVTRARGALADLDRFTAASVLAELMLRFAHDVTHEALFDALVDALDALAASRASEAHDRALGGAWHLIAVLGFAPALDLCCSCHARVPEGAAAAFSHPLGGVLCARCAGAERPTRTLPPTARAALTGWLSGRASSLGTDGERRAHMRLLREFLHEHLTDGRPLVAFEIWEHAGWGAGARATPAPRGAAG
jgi:DNA repair protein RecO (recombination protein O)